MKMFIICGGFGTRLQSVISEIPKSLAPVNGIPFIKFLIDDIQASGLFSEIILCLGYKSEMIISYIDKIKKDIDIEIKYSIENEPLGTGGAIRLALINNESAKNEKITILNGDTLIDVFSTGEFNSNYLRDSNNYIFVKKVIDAGRYGAIDLNNENIVQKIQEKDDNHKEAYINTGCIVIDSQYFLKDWLYPFHINTVLEKCIVEKKMFAVKTDSYFIDIGIPADYKLFQEYKLQ